MGVSEMDGRLGGRRRDPRLRTGMDGGSADVAVVATLVAVISLADAQRGVALDDSVRVWATRDRVDDGDGGGEGEVEEGEQE